MAKEQIGKSLVKKAAKKSTVEAENSEETVKRKNGKQRNEEVVTFQEEDQVIMMEVDKGDESYASSSSEVEEDHEISFKSRSSNVTTSGPDYSQTESDEELEEEVD